MFQMDAKKKALLAQRVQRLKRASEEFDNAVNSAKKSKVGGAKEASRNSRAEKSVADVAPKENKFKAKLEGAEFRWINEQLYTTSGDHSKKLFEEEPSRFWSYHTGFRRQVSKWPVNPLDVLSKEIVELSKREGKPLIVADLGCGEAKLREKLMMDGNSSSFQVHSFDLVAANEHVIASDIADVPLSNLSIDVAVFSLSLMGVNFAEFIIEANRILREKGILKIAEVQSRIEDPKALIKFVTDLGFRLLRKDSKNSFFIQFDFQKERHLDCSPSEKESIVKKGKNILKPCKYKKR